MARVTISRSKNNEWQQKLLELRRVTRVVSGGKRMSFRVVMIIGDQKGKVGVGVAKGKDVARATEKAVFQAKKNVFQVPVLNGTIPHQVDAKHSSAKIVIKPARKGHGLIAGGAARVVLSFAGIKDATAKNLGRTTNKLTNAEATVKALKKLKTPVVSSDAS